MLARIYKKLVRKTQPNCLTCKIFIPISETKVDMTYSSLSDQEGMIRDKGGGAG